MKQDTTPQQATLLAYQAILPGKFEYAEHMFRAALKQLRGQATLDIHYTLGLTGLGQVCLLQGRFEEAERLFQEALSHYEKDFVDDSFGRFFTLCHLGSVNLEQGILAKARSFYERALTLGEEVLRDQPKVLAYGCLRGYADVLKRLELPSEADAIEQRFKSIVEYTD